MSNWFSWIRSSDYPTPQGFRKISELKCADSQNDITYPILDWRPTPIPPHEPGSYFIWLEIDGKREQFHLSKAESAHFDTTMIAIATNVRVVKNRGCWYVLPVNLRKESSLRVLPSPPKEFPAPGKTW